MRHSESIPRGLLLHLDELYRLAYLFTSDAETAARWIREVFQEAMASPPPDDQLRPWLIARLMERVRTAEAPTEALLTARQELVESILSRVLPAAMMLLSPQDRRWLYLCEVLGLSPATAASLLQESPEGYAQAHNALMTTLRCYLTPGQFALLEFGLSEEQIRSHLQQALHRLLPPPPSSLRTELLNLVSGEAPSATPSSRTTAHRPATRILVALLIVLVAGLLGWLAWQGTRTASTSAPPRTFDLIRRSAELAPSLSVKQPITRPIEAEHYLARQGWRVVIPDIAAARLIGLTQAPVLPDLNVPVLLFEDQTSGRTLAIYLYSYALLDRYHDQLTLSADVLRQIEEEQHFDLHVLGSRQVLVWRYRDDIYVAVTEGDAAALRERIAFPS